MTLLEKYSIQLDLDTQKSSEYISPVISHYAMTKNSAYKNEAITEIKSILINTYSFEKISNTVADNAISLWVDKFYSVPFPGPMNGEEKFTFIDLFAGIGGFRMALQDLGGKCLFSSEWDKYSQQTYRANYGETPFGDITKQEVKRFIPKKFDILCGGFPCQPFSIAGVSKKISLGKKHGFEDEKQGNLFFHLAEIIKTHRPKVFFLENVKNLVSHDKGNTFKVIKETLEGLNYSFDRRIIDGKYFVPQHRERTIMVGFDKNYFGENISFNFDNVILPKADKQIKSILQNHVDSKYTLTDHLWNYLQEYARKHKENGNGFGFGLVDLNNITRTISARYHKDGSEILIPQKNKNPRRLTPKECALLQGYPENFVIPVSDTQAYRQFGNSVVMPLIKAVGKEIINVIDSHYGKYSNQGNPHRTNK